MEGAAMRTHLISMEGRQPCSLLGDSILNVDAREGYASPFCVDTRREQGGDAVSADVDAGIARPHHQPHHIQCDMELELGDVAQMLQTLPPFESPVRDGGNGGAGSAVAVATRSQQHRNDGD